MLAAPPAAAITYVNPSNGLDPSVYGGGGSPSSRSLLEEASLSLVSRGRAALVSATTLGNEDEDGASKGGAGAKAGRLSGAQSLTRLVNAADAVACEGK